MDRSVRDEFFLEIQKSHRPYSFVDVVSPTQQKIRLEVTGGGVTVDRNNQIRRSCTMSCVDRTGELTPEDASSILAPGGPTLFPYRGVIFPGTNTAEVVPLGVFRISKSSVKDTSQGLTISLDGYDLSRTVARDKFQNPVILDVGMLVTDAIKSILAMTFGDLVYDIQGSPRTITSQLVYDRGSDPWAVVVELAQSIGCEIYFDTVGRVVIASPVDISALPTPDFYYVEGENCTLLDTERTFTDDPGYNGVVVTGESPGDALAPVVATAWDDDKSSVTYHLGPYGEVPLFITDSLVKTTQEAQDMANQLLRNILGFASQLNITTAVNPAYECGDVIKVTREKSKIDDIFSIDAFNIPLGAQDTQSIILRQKRRTS